MADCATLCANLAYCNAAVTYDLAQLDTDYAAQAMASMAVMEAGCDCSGGGMAMEMPVFSGRQKQIVDENPVIKRQFDRLSAKLAAAKMKMAAICVY